MSLSNFPLRCKSDIPRTIFVAAPEFMGIFIMSLGARGWVVARWPKIKGRVEPVSREGHDSGVDKMWGSCTECLLRKKSKPCSRFRRKRSVRHGTYIQQQIAAARRGR